MKSFTFRGTPQAQSSIISNSALAATLMFIILLLACGDRGEPTIPANTTPKSTSLAARPDTPDSLNLMPDEGAAREVMAAESPCELTLDRVGEKVKVSGQIVFIEKNLPAGVFAKLTQSECTVGLFVDRDYWNSWNEAYRAPFTVGAWVESEGYLGAYLGELEVQMTTPLTVMEGSQVGTPTLIHMTPCEVTSGQVGDLVRLSGYISFIDYSDPNGQFAELDGKGCRAGLWADREEILAWSTVAQSLFQVSSSVIVEGVLTTSDGKMIVELVVPPYQ